MTSASPPLRRLRRYQLEPFAAILRAAEAIVGVRRDPARHPSRLPRATHPFHLHHPHPTLPPWTSPSSAKSTKTSTSIPSWTSSTRSSSARAASAPGRSTRRRMRLQHPPKQNCLRASLVGDEPRPATGAHAHASPIRTGAANTRNTSPSQLHQANTRPRPNRDNRDTNASKDALNA